MIRLFNILLCLLPAAALEAAPKLRLMTTTVGPVAIAVGQNGTTQIVDAANFGDGSLSLTASASVSWIAPSVGGQRGCALNGVCFPVQMALNTVSLAKGFYTGIVTVSDPNAIDAPQTIVVTVQVGGGVPDSLDLYLPPNSSTTTSFTTGSRLNPTMISPVGGPTLSIAATGGGSFTFTFSYQVTANAPAGIAEGDYTGGLNVLNSTFPADVKNVPVRVHVTSQPIAILNPAAIQFRVAQGAAKVDKWIPIYNAGSGTLTVTGASVSTAPWLAVTTNGNTAVLTFDPTGLAPGPYSATATISSNARNGPSVVPVEMDVIPAGPPVAFYQGVRDNATFEVGVPVSPGSIVEIVGDQFTTGPPALAPSVPLGPSLGGAMVYVNNEPAPVYYVAASHVVNQGGQINFQIPYDIVGSEAIVRVDRDGQRGNSIAVPVQPASPRLLVFGSDAGGLAGYAIAQFSDLAFPIPPTPGVASRPAKAGDTLTFYALGFGQTNPPVTAGFAAPGTEPFARVPGTPRVMFGGASIFVTERGVAIPSYVGLTPNSVGLYQINVVVPADAPTGDAVPVFFSIGNVLSNRVNIAIQ
jgi:uncharacterized protein (TIGR03437 family)